MTQIFLSKIIIYMSIWYKKIFNINVKYFLVKLLNRQRVSYTYRVRLRCVYLTASLQAQSSLQCLSRSVLQTKSLPSHSPLLYPSSTPLPSPSSDTTKHPFSWDSVARFQTKVHNLLFRGFDTWDINILVSYWSVSVIHKLPDSTPDHIRRQFETAYQLVLQSRHTQELNIR